MLNNIIKIKGLSVRYKEEIAIDKLSLSIERGKSYAIIGKSGCGKTTLLYTMAGLISNYEGELEIGGETSLILQNLGLFNWFTVYRNISLGLNKSDLSKEEKDKLVNRIINELGLADIKHKYPKELSGGQKQRVAIGRTIINNPEILLQAFLTIFAVPHSSNRLLVSFWVYLLPAQEGQYACHDNH